MTGDAEDQKRPDVKLLALPSEGRVGARAGDRNYSFIFGTAAGFAPSGPFAMSERVTRE